MLVLWFSPRRESLEMIDCHNLVSQFSVMPYLIIDHLPMCYNLISWLDLINNIT